MGLFSESQRSSAEVTYSSVRKFLKAKDGRKHVVMLNSFGKWGNQNLQCEDKYTTQVDEIVTAMQHDGFNIIDIKFNSTPNQGLSGNTVSFHTLIIYD